ncbi:membrane protein insertion efficiency factor YidD [Methylophilaceae bacterium]|nr:membrane protein insertion efficiency factor YidD [Methylophilaceae bacterium]MDB2703691.1 membrane protein insertion efficiency factor YidD [Methylophilaceae bacterium]
MSKIIITFIKIYQLGISAFTLPRCRFTPTCSEYTIEVLKIHGTLKGLWLAFKRLLRCHPFCKGGYDPEPK